MSHSNTSWRGATGSSRTHAVIGAARPARDPKTRQLARPSVPAKSPKPKPLSQMSIGERLRLRAQLEIALRENERDQCRIKALLYALDNVEGV